MTEPARNPAAARHALATCFADTRRALATHLAATERRLHDLAKKEDPPTMYHRSDTQPLCRYCRGKIAKHTTSHHFWREDNPPRSREDVQRRFNGIVTQLRWREHEDGTRSVETAHVWDGETYWDGFFCTNGCARAFGREAAEAGWEPPK